MTTKSTHSRLTAPLATLALAASILAGAPAARAADTLMKDSDLVELARGASSPQDHARASRQYRLRAEALEAEAAQLEKTAARLPSDQPPIVHKFPSAFGAQANEGKQRAVQARRAAQEARASAQWHLSRAVEVFFGQ